MFSCVTSGILYFKGSSKIVICDLLTCLGSGLPSLTGPFCSVIPHTRALGELFLSRHCKGFTNVLIISKHSQSTDDVPGTVSRTSSELFHLILTQGCQSWDVHPLKGGSKAQRDQRNYLRLFSWQGWSWNSDPSNMASSYIPNHYTPLPP